MKGNIFVGQKNMIILFSFHASNLDRIVIFLKRVEGGKKESAKVTHATKITVKKNFWSEVEYIWKWGCKKKKEEKKII